MLLETFTSVVDRHPTRIAIVEGSGRSISFAALWARACSFAADWEAKGLREGDRVVLAMPLGIDLYASLAALWLLRATAVLSEPATGLAGLRHAAKATDARAYLSGGFLFGALRYVIPELRRLPLHLRLGSGRFGRGRALVSEPSDAALISFTSGSTGKPKAIVRTHGFLEAQDAALAGLLGHGAGKGADLIAFPVFVLSNLGKGTTSVLPPWDVRKHARLRPGKAAAFMEEHEVSRILAPPAALEALMGTRAPLGLCTVITGGGPVYPDLVRRLTDWKPGIEVVSAYGSTEAEPIAHLSSRDDVSGLSGEGIYAGKPVADLSVRIVDGEIQVSGNHVVRGYLDPADDVSTKVRREGAIWHRTGDAGRLDEAGLWLLGRQGADVRGFSPFVVEAKARSWPGVRHAALGAGDEGRPILAIVGSGNAGEAADWGRRARLLGDLLVVQVNRIPMDRRHGSKVDRKALDRLLTPNVSSRRSR